MRAVEDAIARQVFHGGDLATNLLELAAVREEVLTPLVAEGFGLEVAPSGRLPLPAAEVLRVVPGELALRHGIFPLALRRSTTGAMPPSPASLVLAVAEPLAAAVEDDLGFALDVGIRQVVAPLVRIRQAIADGYGIPLERRFLRLLAKLDGRADPSPSAIPPAGRELLPMRMPRPVSIPSPSFGTGVPSDPAPARLDEKPATKTPFVARPHDFVNPQIPRSPGLPSDALAMKAPGTLSVPHHAPSAVQEESAALEPSARDERSAPAAEPSVRDEGSAPAAEPSARDEGSAPAAEPSVRDEGTAPGLPPSQSTPAEPRRPAATRALASVLRNALREERASAPVDKSRPGARPAWRHAQPRRKGPFTAAMAEQELEEATASDAVLEILFVFAHQFFEYSALFVVHGDLAEGRDASGPGADRARVAGIGVPLDLPSSLSVARERRAPVIGTLAAEGLDAELARDLGRGPRSPARAVALLPIAVRARTVAILYGDDGDAGVELSAIGEVIALIGLAGSALERVALRKKLGSRAPEIPHKVRIHDGPAALARAISVSAMEALSAERIVAAARPVHEESPAPEPRAYGEGAVHEPRAPEEDAPHELRAHDEGAAHEPRAHEPHAYQEGVAHEPHAYEEGAAHERAFHDAGAAHERAFHDAGSSREALAAAPAHAAIAPRVAHPASHADSVVMFSSVAPLEAAITAGPAAAFGVSPPMEENPLAIAPGPRTARYFDEPPAHHEQRSTDPGIGIVFPDAAPEDASPADPRAPTVEVPSVTTPAFGSATAAPLPFDQRPTLQLERPFEKTPAPEARPAPMRRGPAPLYEGRAAAVPDGASAEWAFGSEAPGPRPRADSRTLPSIGFEPLPRTPPPNATAWTSFPSPPPPPSLGALAAQRPRSERPIPREEDDGDEPTRRLVLSESLRVSGTGAHAFHDGSAPRGHGEANSGLLPTVLVDVAAEHKELIQRVIEGGRRGQEAFDELLQSGEQVIQAVMARFPGPLRVDRHRARAELPAASQCGPILELAVAIRRPALPFISVRTSSPDPEMRFWATHALGELRYLEAATVLVPRLFDDDPAVRRIARRSAAALVGAGPAGAPILKGLEDITLNPDQPKPHRVLAIETMGEIRSGGVVPTLLAALDDPSDDVGEAARRALLLIARQDFGRDARRWQDWWMKNGARHRIEWLIDALMHEQPSVRRAAGDELKLCTKEYFGYYDDLPKRERERAQGLYRAWWEREGRQRFG